MKKKKMDPDKMKKLCSFDLTLIVCISWRWQRQISSERRVKKNKKTSKLPNKSLLFVAPSNLRLPSESHCDVSRSFSVCGLSLFQRKMCLI